MYAMKKNINMKAIHNRTGVPAGGGPYVEKRSSARIKVGDIIHGTSVDPVLRSYIPFRAKVVNLSESGIQLAVKKGSVSIEEGSKILVNPPNTKEISGKSKEAVVIWTKDHVGATVFGCMFTS